MGLLNVNPYAIGSSNIFICTCNTAAATAAKEANMVDTSYVPSAGDIFAIEFVNGVNVAGGTGITLNINNSGAVTWHTVVNSADNAGMDSARARIALVKFTGNAYITLASDAPYISVVTTAVNPSSTPTQDGAIWIQTT